MRVHATEREGMRIAAVFSPGLRGMPEMTRFFQTVRYLADTRVQVEPVIIEGTLFNGEADGESRRELHVPGPGSEQIFGF
jgi:hypothetical protein